MKTGIAPASVSKSTMCADLVAAGLATAVPLVVTTPARSMLALTENGIPSKVRGFPEAIRCWEAIASASVFGSCCSIAANSSLTFTAMATTSETVPAFWYESNTAEML